MRVGPWILILAITLVLTAIVHFGVVLAIPYASPRDAWSRLEAIIRDDEVVVLPQAVPGQEILPLLDPNVVYAVCTYDVTDGPFAVSAEMPPGYWSISFHTPRGTIFYAVDDEAAIEGALEIELRNPEAMRRYLLAATDQADEVIAVEAPAQRGYVLMRSLVSRGVTRQELASMMEETFCEAVEETVVPVEAPQPQPQRPSFPFPPSRPSDVD